MTREWAEVIVDQVDILKILLEEAIRKGSWTLVGAAHQKAIAIIGNMEANLEDEQENSSTLPLARPKRGP